MTPDDDCSSFALCVLNLTEDGVEVCTRAEPRAPFWLPRRTVHWNPEPEVGETTMATMKEWLALSHRQLVGDTAYENNRNRNNERKTKVADREGSGTLGRNKRKTAPTHADYSGSFVLGGKKHWVNAWLKEVTDEEGTRKFFSLSVRLADPPQTRPANGNAPALDDAIPFAPEVERFALGGIDVGRKSIQAEESSRAGCRRPYQ